MVQSLISNSRFGEEVEEYRRLKSNATRRVYDSAFSLFLSFYQNKHGEGKGFSDYLDRIFEELKKPRRQQRRIAEIELVDFINYLKELGKSNNTIRAYFGAMQNFLKFKQITVSAIFIGNLPPATEKPINHKHEWTIEQIKTFLDSAPTYRDKAIIVCLFQSGLGVNELTQLNYNDIEEELEKDILPICLRLVRQKTGVPFKTFFGNDAVKYLRLYLQTRKELTSDKPLFTKLGSEERITPAAIQQRFSEITEEMSFIKKKDLKGYNPCRPHSLRAAFNSKLKNKISDDLIEFWMGHTLGGVKDAYLNIPTVELHELYKDAEKYLALEKTSRDEIVGTPKISPELEQKIKTLEEKIEWWEKFMEQKVEEVTRKLWQDWLNKLYEEDTESREELYKWQKEFSKRYREQHQRKKETTNEKDKNSSKIESEPSFHELIYGGPK